MENEFNRRNVAAILRLNAIGGGSEPFLDERLLLSEITRGPEIMDRSAPPKFLMTHAAAGLALAKMIAWPPQISDFVRIR